MAYLLDVELTMPDPTVWSWTHPYSLPHMITPILVAVTSFYVGATIWLHAWRTR